MIAETKTQKYEFSVLLEYVSGATVIKNNLNYEAVKRLIEYQTTAPEDETRNVKGIIIRSHLIKNNN